MRREMIVDSGMTLSSIEEVNVQMTKQMDWEKDRRRVTMLLQRTHGGRDLTEAERKIAFDYWNGQKSKKELFDMIFERVIG